MSTPWKEVSISTPTRIVELPNPKPDPVPVYKVRYTQEYPAGRYAETAERTEREVYNNFSPKSSVLLFGSGHSYWANRSLCHPSIDKVVVVDYVKEAGLGLVEGIEFYCSDMLSYTGPQCDYVYSSHTVEHFPRQTVLDSVLPTCLSYARKAVVFVVPYGEYWSDEPSHCCLFYETDELTALATRYKVIRDGKELVLWFEVN